MDIRIKLTAGALILKRDAKPSVLMRPEDGAFFAPENLAARLVGKGKAVYVDEVIEHLAAAADTAEKKRKVSKKTAAAVEAAPVEKKPDHIADAGNMVGEGGDKELEDVSWGDMTRDELNDLARQFDVEEPEKLPNKASVISAINEKAHEQA